MTPTKETIKDAVINCLRTIYDPEIPVNIYDLGLIYNIHIDDEFNVTIIMTLTAPDCPEAEYMVAQARELSGYIEGVKSVNVHLFTPSKQIPFIACLSAIRYNASHSPSVGTRERLSCVPMATRMSWKNRSFICGKHTL